MTLDEIKKWREELGYSASCMGVVPSLEKIDWLIAVAEETVKYYDYIKTFSCEDSCDPSVGHHEPECCIASDLHKLFSQE